MDLEQITFYSELGNLPPLVARLEDGFRINVRRRQRFGNHFDFERVDLSYPCAEPGTRDNQGLQRERGVQQSRNLRLLTRAVRVHAWVRGLLLWFINLLGSST
jgi:hypothetical protein